MYRNINSPLMLFRNLNELLFNQNTLLTLMELDTVKYLNHVPWKMEETEARQEAAVMAEEAMLVIRIYTMPRNTKYTQPYRESNLLFHHSGVVAQALLVLGVPKDSIPLTD